jgi:uroporphyrinogen decarboxylase
LRLVERTTDLCIRWLKSQLDRMDSPVAVLVLDDLAGMMSPADAERFSLPYLKRIFDAFPGLVHIFHNDSPNKAVYGGLAGIGMDVFNFSHEIDAEQARSLLGPDIVLMGNVAPLGVLVRGTPDDVRRETEELLDGLDRKGPLIVSPGGGVSPGTPISNLQALMNAADGR